jgi:hypothetical protein
MKAKELLLNVQIFTAETPSPKPLFSISSFALKSFGLILTTHLFVLGVNCT